MKNLLHISYSFKMKAKSSSTFLKSVLYYLPGTTSWKADITLASNDSRNPYNKAMDN